MIELTRRRFAAGALVALGAMLAPPRPAAAQSASAGPPDPQLLEDLVAANHILVDQGVLDGYGHVSARHDRDPSRFLMSALARPRAGDRGRRARVRSRQRAGGGGGRTSYLERFIHGEIYRARPDVRAIVHSHSPS
jgi:HCOMODA/2-hydroxy-3-carboxy-muconic semialdehyde decarboxylase